LEFRTGVKVLRGCAAVVTAIGLMSLAKLGQSGEK
jgi:hypothetical protein